MSLTSTGEPLPDACHSIHELWNLRSYYGGYCRLNPRGFLAWVPKVFPRQKIMVSLSDVLNNILLVHCWVPWVAEITWWPHDNRLFLWNGPLSQGFGGLLIPDFFSFVEGGFWYYFTFYFIWDRISYSPGWPWTHSVAGNDFEGLSFLLQLQLMLPCLG